MRHYSAKLRAELFRLRKRKQLSLDGLVPGLQVSRYRRGLHAAEAPLGWSHTPTGPETLYDQPARYEDFSMEYQPAAPWFEQLDVPRTPFLRFGHERAPVPKAADYRDSLITQDLATEAFTEAASIPPEFPPESLGDLAPVSNPELDAMAEAIMPGPAYEAAVMDPQMFEQTMAGPTGPGELGMEPDLPPGLPDAFAESAAGPDFAGDPDEVLQGGLEACLDPMGPDMMNPYDHLYEMYDEQMERLMNPFAAPSMGMPGPMPPGPGPGPMGFGP